MSKSKSKSKSKSAPRSKSRVVKGPQGKLPLPSPKLTQTDAGSPLLAFRCPSDIANAFIAQSGGSKTMAYQAIRSFMASAVAK